MRVSILSCLITMFLLSVSGTLSAQQKEGFHIAGTFHIASPGGWDYLAVAPGTNMLYVSHGTQVNILDKNTGDSAGVIPNTAGVHGIAFVAGLNRGYTSNGRTNNVTVFELSTNKVLKQISTGDNPDAILYDPFSKKIITCNGRSKNLTLIDIATDNTTSIEVGGKPETAVSDNAGKVYVNIEDKNEIVVVDMRSNKVLNHWALAGGEGPTGLAIDRNSKKLFAGCEKLLVVLDATNGRVVDKLPIGDGCDGVAFDNGTHTIFTSNGEGTMTVIRESAGAFAVTETVPTKKGARTIAIDEASHTLFLPTAEYGPAPAQGGRAPVIPGSFQVLVLKK